MILRQGMTDQRGFHFSHTEQIRNRSRELVNLSKVAWLEVEGLGREATFQDSLVPLSLLH